MQPLTKCLTIFSVASLLITGCSSLDSNSGQNGVGLSTGDPELRTLLVEQGYDDDKLIEREHDFIFDGDMVISKSSIQQIANGSLNKSLQRTSTFTLTYTRAANIKYKIDASLYNWEDDVRFAVNAWNDIGSNVHFEEAFINPDIIIYSDMASNCPDDYKNLGPTVGGLTNLPQSRTVPGSVMSLNYDHPVLQDQTSRRAVIIHELGHCFGFEHTNDNSMTLITGTPTSDNLSIMNSSYNPSVNTLSYYDILAARIKWPIQKRICGVYISFDSEEMPSGYKKINWDLNRTAGGSYIYCGIARDFGSVNSSLPGQGKYLTDLNVFVNNQPSAPYYNAPSKACPSGGCGADLNKGAGGDYLYLGYSWASNHSFITDLYVIEGENPTVPSGWQRVAIDLNKGCGSQTSYIWFIFRR